MDEDQRVSLGISVFHPRADREHGDDIGAGKNLRPSAARDRQVVSERELFRLQNQSVIPRERDGRPIGQRKKPPCFVQSIDGQLSVGQPEPGRVDPQTGKIGADIVEKAVSARVPVQILPGQTKGNAAVVPYRAGGGLRSVVLREERRGVVIARGGSAARRPRERSRRRRSARRLSTFSLWTGSGA